MHQYTLDDLNEMSLVDIAKIEDPMDLMACSSMAPMVIRYALRTGQAYRYAAGQNNTPALIYAITVAAVGVPVPIEVSQLMPHAERNPVVDEYLDAIQVTVTARLAEALS